MATAPTHRRRTTPDRSIGGRRRTAAWLPALLAIAGLVAGCTPSERGAPGGPSPVYALNALDGTLTPLDAERASPAGPPLPAGEAPAQAARGPGGSVLVLAFSRTRPAGLTRVVRDGGGWRALPVPLSVPLHRAVLAADGERWAAVAHHPPGQSPPAAGRPAPGLQSGACRLTLLDLAAGGARPGTAHPVCAPGEQVTGLALGAGPDGPAAYLGVWDAQGLPAVSEPAPPAAAPRAPGAIVPRGLRDRVVAVDARTGAVLAARAVASPPEHLQLLPPDAGRGRPDGRLYVLEGAPGAESEYSPLGRWRLLGLNPATLEAEQEAVLGVQVRALAVAPDGAHAYALAAGGKDVLHVDLTTGVTRRLGALPGYAPGGLAVTARHVLAPDPLGDAVWALDRRNGRLTATIPVGRRPIAVVVAGAAG